MKLLPVESANQVITNTCDDVGWHAKSCQAL